MLKKIASSLKGLFSRSQETDNSRLEAGDVEKLRLTFKSRYHSFKLLLANNNRILEAMADMEKALQGVEPFSMSFVQSNSTKVSVNVFRMIGDMENICPGQIQCAEGFLQGNSTTNRCPALSEEGDK